MIKKLLIVFFIFFSFISFFKLNEINYEKHNEIKKIIVKHPDNLPKKEVAIATSFGFKNIRADYYWLKTIQYVWGNAYHSEYKEYLYKILDLVTELNPYFESPYHIGQLLLPAYEARYEFISQEEQQTHVEESIVLWLKWIKNFCDFEKIKLIEEENDLLKIWTNKEFKNPCLSYSIPFYLWYTYFFYKNDPLEAARYYKIASAIESSPSWAKTMAALMQWKWGDREKAYFMFLSLSNYVWWDVEVCNIIRPELENIWYWVFWAKTIILDWNLIKAVNDIRYKTFWDEEKDNILNDTMCSNYINKAVRELNLAYLDKANKKYEIDNWEFATTPKILYDKWYIDYLPTDYQQYWDNWIEYIFNSKLWYFDYIMTHN